MNVGDVIQIKGRLGFLLDPQMVVLEQTEDCIKLISKSRLDDDGGALSHMNAQWYSKEIIRRNIAV